MCKREFSHYVVYFYIKDSDGNYSVTNSFFYDKDKMIEHLKEKSKNKQIYNIEVEEIYNVDWRTL